MKIKFFLPLLLMLVSQYSFAIVKRHDVPSEKYEGAEVPEFFIDMPHEGHGALIAPNWIVTVAHLIFYDYTGKKIVIDDIEYVVEKVIKHPNYRTPEKSLTQGDAKPLMSFRKSVSDIALVKLSKNVEGVSPIRLYENEDELQQVITAFGRGSTGNGLIGSQFETKKQKILRTMKNRVEEVEGNWISIKFDNTAKALELEGIDGSGDSGGPLIIYKNKIPYLVGLFSWDYVEGKLSDFKPGLYGQKSFQVRISRYRDWIENIMQNN